MNADYSKSFYIMFQDLLELPSFGKFALVFGDEPERLCFDTEAEARAGGEVLRHLGYLAIQEDGSLA